MRTRRFQIAVWIGRRFGPQDTCRRGLWSRHRAKLTPRHEGDCGRAWLGNELFDCSKRQSFVRFIDLPRRTTVNLELAANIHPVEQAERNLFTSHGRRLIAPEVEVRTPQQFHAYVQQSQGPVACESQGMSGTRTVGRYRSVCYLASWLMMCTAGHRRVTGSSGVTRSCFFSTTAEAVDCLAVIEKDYPAVRARNVSRRSFLTSVHLPQSLSSGASAARRPGTGLPAAPLPPTR